MGDTQALHTEFTADVSELLSAVKHAVDAIKSVGKDTKTAAKEVKEESKQMTDGFNAVTNAVNGIKTALKALISVKVLKFFADSIKLSISFIERLNLFKVAAGDTADELLRFVNSMSEMLGLDPSTLLKTVGTFKQLASSIGLASEQADMLAKNFTKAAIDIASLFEITVSDAIEKLQAGLVGLPKSLRDIGIITTTAALQQEALALGISESVRNMTEINKVGLRYIAIMRQMKNAMGDFAKTIESPANQLRVMSEQLTRLRRAIGNLFIGMLSQILPYINGFIMALRTLIELLGTMMGFKPMEFESSMSGASTAIGGIGDELDSATKKAKQLLAPFDELNILAESTADSGGGGASFGEMDPRIADAMKEYDNLMDSVRMKANDVRDTLMQILGFTKQINQETGEITWTWNFEDMISGLQYGAKLLVDSWKDMSVGQKVATVFVSGWVAFIVGKGISLLLTPFKGIGASIGTLLTTAIKSVQWPALPPLDLSVISTAATNIGTILSTVATALLGFLGSIAGFFTIFAGTIIVAIVDLWNNNEEFRDKVINAWNRIKDQLAELLAFWKEKFEGARQELEFLWDKVKWLYTSLVEIFQPTVEKVLEFLKNSWEDFKNFVSAIIGNLLDGLSGLLEFLLGIFTGDWDRALAGLKTIFENVFKGIGNFAVLIINNIIHVFESGINWIISGLNSLIDAWNDTVEDIPGIGGAITVGNISDVSFGRLPYFERGGMAAAGSLFQAGENGKAELYGSYGGKTTVMPLEDSGFVAAMQSAVTQGVLAAGSAGGGNQEIKVVIGGREWDTEIYRAGQRGQSKVGQTPVRGAFNV